MIRRITQYHGKDVFYGTGTSAQLCTDVATLMRYFICVVFLDGCDWPEPDLRNLIQALVQSGAAYLLFHGNQSERAHDIADEVQVDLMHEITNENVIGTRWHAHASEEEVFFSAFAACLPADDYSESLSSYVILALGNVTAARRVQTLSENLPVTIEVGRLRLDEGDDGKTH